ncbi:MAG: hypothetical protein CMJ81_05275 [Planctomycetaceae bacterium]|nr:hypothetical protein [Planctomycetaceae bacterium]
MFLQANFNGFRHQNGLQPEKCHLSAIPDPGDQLTRPVLPPRGTGKLVISGLMTMIVENFVTATVNN